MTSAQYTQFWIVTPSFNQGKYLAQTIESLLQQTTGLLKYWVIDGGSSDETLDLLKKQPRQVKWLSEKDKGQTHALNKGLQRLEKEATNALDPDQIYVAYLNSDDYYLPATFKSVEATFTQHPQAAWLVGDCQIVNQKNQKIQSSIQRYKKIWRCLPLKWALSILNPVPQPAVFMRLSAVRKVGFFNQSLRYVMDYEYWWRLVKTVGEPVIIEEELAAFRIHQASKGGSQYQKQFAEEYQVARQYVTNPLLLFLHWLHTLSVVTIYRVLK